MLGKSLRDSWEARPWKAHSRFTYWFALFFSLALSAHADWDLALPGWHYAFPRDHYHHPGFKTEWWYFTGNLQAEDGREFGYQLTFFRQGILDPGAPGAYASRFVTREMKFAHFAISDLSGKQFWHAQKVSRGAFGEAGFSDGERVAWIGSWSLSLGPGDSFILSASEGDSALDLVLRPEKPPVFHGENGVSQKGANPGEASHYYSYTRLRTEGTLTHRGKTHAVRGLSWFDHEWATNQLGPEQVGWDWFSVQFEDGSDLMLFQLRTKSGGRDAASSGTFVDAEGRSETIRSFTLEPLRFWNSRKTGARYPVAWKIGIPGSQLEIEVAAALEDQELPLEPVAYWEGAIRVTGKLRGSPIRGKGYLEMTGYSGPVRMR